METMSKPKPPEAPKDQIRWMIRRDLPDVLRVEAEAFPEPWSEDDFLKLLRQRNAVGVVAEHGTEIVGYLLYELHKGRVVVVNIAVAKAHRFRGVGRYLIGKAKIAAARGGRAVRVTVCERNLEAQVFYRKTGFKAIRFTRGVGDEDGTIDFSWKDHGGDCANADD
jgi:ribosomal-protein-alanine N-acetyltransferase